MSLKRYERRSLMATIKDVAQAAQVSTAAVSRVLNKDDNISVSPEVRARIFQAAHVLGYVSPRQRKAAEHKTHLVIGVADWRIIRPDRHNVRLSSLSCLVQRLGGVQREGNRLSTLPVLRHRLCELQPAQLRVRSGTGGLRPGPGADGVLPAGSETVHRPGVYRRYLRRGQWPHRHPPSGRHPAHLGEARPVRSPNLPCGGNQSRKWLCAGQEGRGRAYLGGSSSVGQ